jgi:hypothetical protein
LVIASESAERLVQDHDLGIVDHRARELRAPLHAAGELRWVLVAEVLQADFRQQEFAELARLGRQLAAGARAIEDVVPRGHPWEERRFLEQHEAVSRGAGHRLAVERDRSRRRSLEPGEKSNERALAATRRADHHRELGALDRERALADDLLSEVRGAVALADVVGPELARLDRRPQRVCLCHMSVPKGRPRV